jgi:ATP-binding cassette, subfamily B, bacterial PglK
MYKDLKLLINFSLKYFKSKIIYLQFLIIFSSLVQLLSIFSFGPLILLLLDSDKIKEYQHYYFDKMNDEQFFLLLIISIAVLFIISNLLNILVSKKSLNFGQEIGIKLNNKLFNNIIFKDYSYHLNQNSSEIISKMTLENARVVNSILIPILLINSRIIILLFVFFGLLMFNFIASILVFFFLLMSYYIILSINKNRFSVNSKIISKNNFFRQKIISESLGNMRETIMFEARKFFLDLFQESNERIAYSIANNQYLSSIPKFVIEIFIFIFLLGLIYFLKSNDTLNIYLPLIGIYLIAGYKLLPALQAIASSYASIKGNHSSLQNIKEEIDIILNNENKSQNHSNNIGKFETIILEDINFSHKNNLIFKSITLEIKKNEIIGIIGETGSGKSTFIDILCGLLNPNKGKIKLNKVEMLKNEIKNLHKIISIVPQRINLLDDTIKNNILYAHKFSNERNIEERINDLKDVCLLDYIDEKENGWNSIVGENGAKLSGGQIQRLGIARALFKKPQILILDEATSGLDKQTEEKLLNNLINFRPKLTIIIISHNKTILNICNKVYKIFDQNIQKLSQND